MADRRRPVPAPGRDSSRGNGRRHRGGTDTRRAGPHRRRPRARTRFGRRDHRRRSHRRGRQDAAMADLVAAAAWRWPGRVDHDPSRGQIKRSRKVSRGGVSRHDCTHIAYDRHPRQNIAQEPVCPPPSPAEATKQSMVRRSPVSRPFTRRTIVLKSRTVKVRERLPWPTAERAPPRAGRGLKDSFRPSRFSLQAIAHAVHGGDELGIPRIVLQLPPQPGHVRVHRPRGTSAS